MGRSEDRQSFARRERGTSTGSSISGPSPYCSHLSEAQLCLGQTRGCRMSRWYVTAVCHGVCHTSPTPPSIPSPQPVTSVLLAAAAESEGASGVSQSFIPPALHRSQTPTPLQNHVPARVCLGSMRVNERTTPAPVASAVCCAPPNRLAAEPAQDLRTLRSRSRYAAATPV